MCVDLPVATLPAPTLLVRGGHSPDNRGALARGESVIVARTPDDGVAVGQRFLVRRLPSGEDAFQPRGSGYAALKTTGWVTISAVDDLNAVALIDFACDPIEPGDYLEPFADLALPTSLTALVPPDFSERVQILPGLDGRLTFADGDTFSIARGTEHGVAAGARYAIYRDKKDGRPLVHIGEAMVADPAPATAKVLLVSTVDVVYTDDVAVPRRPQQ
jgi:hypothetical protein